MAFLAMLHVTARMVGGHSGWLEVGWKLGALSCCACKTWRRWRLRAVVRAVMLSDCCAGAPCRDMGSWARIMWPCRDRALLTARAGGWERLNPTWLKTRSRLGFGGARGMVGGADWASNWGAGEAPRVCVSEVMLMLRRAW